MHATKGNIDRYCVCMARYLTWRLPTKLLCRTLYRTVQRYFRLHVVASGGIWPPLAWNWVNCPPRNIGDDSIGSHSPTRPSRVKYQTYHKYHTTKKRVMGTYTNQFDVGLLPAALCDEPHHFLRQVNILFLYPSPLRFLTHLYFYPLGSPLDFPF